MIQLDDLRAFAGVALLAAQPGDPHGERAEFFLQRHHLAQCAAHIGCFFPKFLAILRRLLLDGLRGLHGFDFDAPVFLKPRLQLVGFWKEQIRIERENREPEAGFDRVINHHQTCSLKTRPDRRASAELVPNPAEHIGERRGFKLRRQPLHLIGRDF